MPTDAKNHDARYSTFVISMLAATAKEEAEIASYNAMFAEPTAAQSLETIRPSKVA